MNSYPGEFSAYMPDVHWCTALILTAEHIWPFYPSAKVESVPYQHNSCIDHELPAISTQSSFNNWLNVQEADIDMDKKHSNQTNSESSKLNIPNKKLIQSSGSGLETPKSTILRMPDRDVVVIDNVDIKESTKNDSVIIVEHGPPQMVDMIDILGDKWPQNAGVVSEMLNKDKSSSKGNGQTHRERNKSANVFSHISNSRQSNGFKKSK